jgi:YD repeat-containing protein
VYDNAHRLRRWPSGQDRVGQVGEPGAESLYAYDEVGRLLNITNHPREGGRTNFRYDAEGRKTATQTFEPETLLGLQNTAFAGSAWDAIQMRFGVPVGGKVTTTCDQNDQPTQAEVNEANGQVTAEKPG